VLESILVSMATAAKLCLHTGVLGSSSTLQRLRDPFGLNPEFNEIAESTRGVVAFTFWAGGVTISLCSNR